MLMRVGSTGQSMDYPGRASGGSVRVPSEPGRGGRVEVRVVPTNSPIGSADDHKGAVLAEELRNPRAIERKAIRDGPGSLVRRL